MTKIIDSLETDLAVGTRADTASSAANSSLVSLAREILDTVGAYEGGDILDVLGLLDDAAAAGVVTEVDTIMAYIKQLVTEGISRDAVIGALDDAAAAGAVTDADTLMAYMKQSITLQIARDAVLGALDDAAASGAVTDADTAIAYIKQLVTEGIARDAVVGALADAAASGVVTEVDTIMAYIKQLVTEGITRDGVVGALADAAASGAVTEVDTIMAYVKQVVTEGIARDTAIGVIDGYHDVPAADVGTNTTMRDVIGNKTDAAANGAVTEVESLMAYIKQLVTEGIARDVIIGAKDDSAATGPVTNTDTAMAYIKQLVTELQVVDEYHDKPTADSTDNDQMRDVVGNKADAAAAGAVSATESLMAYAKQLVTEGIARDSVIGALNTSAASGAVTDSDMLMAYVKQLVTEGIARDAVIATMLAGAKRVARKQVDYDGQAGNGAAGTVALFTVTGAVKLKIYAICTDALVEANSDGTTEVGISGATTLFIAQTTSVDIDTGEVWHDATPDAAVESESVITEKILGNGQDVIQTITTRAITDGTIVFVAEWVPLTADGALVAA